MKRARRREEPAWLPVDMATLADCWAVYNNDPILRACRNAVVARLLGQGVVFADAGFKRLTDETFFNHVQRHFVGFCRELIDAVCVQGFAAFTVDRQEAVPRCVPFGAGEFRFRVGKHWRTELALFVIEDGEERGPLRDVFFAVDTAPDLRGAPSSAVSTYARPRYFKDLLERQAAVAEALRARPPLYTTTRTVHAFDEASIYKEALPTRSSAIANSLSEERARANMLVRNRIVMDAFVAQDRLVRALNARHLDTSVPGWEREVDPLTGLPAFRTQDDGEGCPVIPLPADAAVAHAPQAQARSDLVAIQEHTARLACLIMGVPPIVVGLPHAGAMTATTEVGQSQLGATAERWSFLLTRVLLDVYELLYERRDAVVVVFPALRDGSQVDGLFSQGVLTYDSYKDSVARRMTMSKDSFERRDPRVEEAEKKRGS
jgi:hypothetical protein